MNTEKYYVVEHCSEDNWEQISQSIDYYENAIKFKDSDFVKNRFPKAFIVSTVPSQLLKQNIEMREFLQEYFDYNFDHLGDPDVKSLQSKVKSFLEITNP